MAPPASEVSDRDVLAEQAVTAVAEDTALRFVDQELHGDPDFM